MKRQTKPRLRLLALNLVLVLLCSLALPLSAGAASTSINLGYGASDAQGSGWSYSAQDRVLVLNGYRGGPIRVTGDLTIYSDGNVSVTAGGNSHGIYCGGNGYTDTNLYIVVRSGKMTVNGSGSGSGIEVRDKANGASVGVGLTGGSLEVNGGSEGMGIFSSSIFGALSVSKTWKDAEGTEHYDGREGSGTLTVTGGRLNQAISSSMVLLDVDGTITGGSSAPAISFGDTLCIGNDSAGVEGSALNLTVKAGSTKQNALDKVSGWNNEVIVGEHIGETVSYFNPSTQSTPHTLTFYPKTYTTTINGDGGMYNGQETVTISQAYPYHVKLSDYAFTRQDYELTGFQVDGKSVSSSYEFMPAGDTAVTAQWQYVGKHDVSDQMTFTQKQTKATYSGADMALNTFVDPAVCSAGSGAITYTLSKDGGAAQTVTLDSTVKDAGSYTITARYEDEDNLGTKSLFFTIEKAVPVLTVDPEALTVIVDTQKTINASAKLANAQELLPLTVTSSNSKVASATYDNGVVTVKGEATGKATLTIAYPGDSNIQAVSKTVDVEVIDLPKQDVSFTQAGDRTATYGDEAFTNAAVNKSEQGGAISYASSNEKVATVDQSGKVTILGAGETTITATAAQVADTWAETAVSYTLTVAPKAITANAKAAEKTYDGSTKADVTVSFDGLVNGDQLAAGVDYSVAANYADPNAGEGKTVQVSLALKNTAAAANYTLSNPSITLNDGKINKAPAKVLADQNIYIRFDDVTQYSRSLANLMPALAGVQKYTMGQVADPDSILATYGVDQKGIFTFGLKDSLTESDVGKTAAAPILITSNNYEDSTAKMVVNVVYGFVPVADVEDITVTYTGQPVADSAIRGTATYQGETVEGTWSFKEGQELTNVADSGPKVAVFTPVDPLYISVETTLWVEIQKADPTGQPGYTPIHESGKTLADAALNVGTITPAGTISWDEEDETEVLANTDYHWTFVPNDTANYNTLTGTIRPFERSSGGGVAYAINVEESSGGTVTASHKNASKWTQVTLTVKPETGYVLDQLSVTGEDGEVKLTDKGNGKYSFVMPGSAVTVEATFTQEGALPFADVKSGDWFYDAVAYVYDQDMMNGVSNSQFGPNTNLTRAMIAQVLYSMENTPAASSGNFTDVAAGSWYADAVNWAAAQGIVTGYGNGTFGPEDNITREQMALILYQYAGMKGYDRSKQGDLSVFLDAAQVSDWAKEAMSWAVGEGLLSGKGSGVLDPTGTATRAEVAQILMNFCEDVAQ